MNTEQERRKKIIEENNKKASTERERRKKIVEENNKNSKRTVWSDTVSKKTTSPSVINSGSSDIYKPSTQTAKATVSAGDFAGTSKRMTGKIDMRADEEAASLAEKFVNLPEAERQKMITEHISKPNTKVSAAETVLKRQQAESKTAWENEKAEYNRQQAAKKAETVNTPMSEKYNLMTDDELEKSRKETAELLAQREKQTGGKTKQIFELIGAVAKDEEYKADNTLEYLRKESNAASAEATQRYQDKFYSMSDEERELVATVNAYSMNDIRASEYNGAVTTKEYNAAREILKAKYAYSDDDITAMTYFYNRYANERRAQKDDINARLAMAEHPFLESVASVPMGLIGGVAALEGISDSYVDNKRVEKLGIEDQGIDYNHAASRMQRNAQSGRTEFTDTHDFMIGDYDVGDMLYNTALSGLESAAAAAVPGGALILGVNAGTAKANELARRGLSSEQSIMGGIAAGTFEAIFEEVSIGNILKEVDAKTIKDVALNIGKSMLTNFSEESATEIANIMYDSIMHGDKSEEAIQIQNLVSSGKYTEEQARKEVLKGQVLQVIEAGASGALMGAGFGAVGTAGSYIDNSLSLAATGATAKKNGMTGAIIAEGQAAPEGSKSRGLADKLAEKQKDKGKVNSYKLGQLAMENSKYSASVTEGTFAGIDSKAKLEEAYETAKLETAQDKSLTEKEKRKSLDSLYTEYQSANTKLSDTKNTETVKSMKDAFNQKLYKELAEVDRAEATNPKIMTEFGEATIDGGNFDSKTEKLGEFKGIFKDKDGDNVVKTTDGIEFKVSDAAQKLTNKTVARLYEKTKDMSAGAANLFIDNYDGESIDEYKRAFDYYYKMGRTGMSISDIRKSDNLFGNYLTAEAQARIANAGLQDREFKSGLTDMSVAEKSKQYKFEAKVLQYVGEKHGVEFIVLDESGKLNAQYLTGTNRVTLFRDEKGGIVLPAAGHETYHFIKDQATDDTAKAEVEALQNYVLEALKENGVDVEAEIARRGEIRDEDTGEIIYATREDCIDELVADSMFDVFTNEKFVENMMKENGGLLEKIAGKVKEILTTIKSAIRMLGISNTEIGALVNDVEKLEHINTTFNSLLEKAGEKYRAEHEVGQKNNTAEAVKYSMKANTNNVIDLSNDNELSAKIKNQHGAERYKVIRDYILNILGNRPIKLSDGKTAFVDRSDALHIANKSGTEKAAHIGKIKKLVENAILYAEDINVQHKKFNYFCYYKADVKYDKRIYSIYLNVGKGKNDSKYHLYDITKNIRDTANRINGLERPKPNEGYALESDVSNDIIPEVKKSVKANFSYKAEHENGKKNNADQTAAKSSGIKFSVKASYDSKMQNTIDGYLESVDEKLLSFIQKYYKNPNADFDRLTLSEVGEKQAKDLKQLFGIDFSGYSNAINKSAVNHVNKRHGENGKQDNSMSNINDFARLKFIIDNYDDIEILKIEDGDADLSKEFRNSDNTPAKLIRMQKKVNGTFYVVEAVAENRYKKIWVASAYIQKNGAVTQVPTTKSSGSFLVSPDSNNIISNESETVKEKFSYKDTSPAQKQIEILYENRNLKQIISLIDELRYSTVTSNVRLKTKDINLVAKKMLKKLRSKYDVNTLTDELAAVYNYMENSESENKAEEVRKALSDLAIKILGKSEMKDTTLYDQYKPVRDFLHEQRVYIPSELKKEIEHRFGDYKSFRNILMGKMMNITTTDETAPTLDEVWQELAEMAPEYFPKDFNEKDIPMQLVAFFEATAPKIVNTYEHYSIDVNEEAAAVAEEFQMEFANVERIKSKHGDYQDLVFKNNQKFIKAKKAYYEELSRKNEQNKAELYKNYQKTLEDYRNRRKETEKRRVLRNKIDRIYNYINRRLVSETDSRNIPENFKKLANAFNGILPDSNNYFSWARFTEFENEYRAMEKGKVFFDDGILQRIIALKEELCSDEIGVKMRNLNIEQLEKLNNIAEHIKHIVQKENELFNDKIKARCETLGLAVHNETQYFPEHSAQEIPEQKYEGRWKDKVKNSIDGFIKGLTKPEYLFGSLGSDTMKFLYDEIRRGENIEAQIIAEAKKFEQETKRKYNYDPRWKNKNIEIEIGGRKVSMTVESAMALYATSKRKQGLQHLLGGGAVVYTHKEIIKDGKKYAEIKKDVIKDAKRNKEQLSVEEINQRALEEYQKHGETEKKVIHKWYKFTEKDIPKIAEALSNDQKQYTDAMVDYITNVIGKKRNEVSMKMFGIEKYKEPYYFPIRVDSHFVDKNIGKQEVVSTIQSQSSAKRTSSYAENPIEIMGFTETVNNHIYDSALYCAYVIPISDFKRVFNYRGSELEGEGVASLAAKEFSVERDLERANGINAVKQIKDFMVALDSGSRYENLMPFSAKLAARAKKVSVMANLSVVVQQPTAVFRAMLYVNPKHFATLANKADIAEMKKWNGCALKKEIGYFDVNMGRTATDYINEYSPDKQAKKDWSIKDRIKNGNIMLTIDQVAGWGATKADEMTWGAIWKACKKQTKTENAELTGDALNAAASELFQKVISKTQVYDSVFTKPDYMRRKEGFAMLATQFMSEPLTSLNMLAEAVCEARNAKGSTQQNEARKFCGRAFACYMTSLVVNSALKSLVYTMRDDDEDESFLEKYIANVTESLTTEPFGMIPYVKDILSIVQGYDLNRTDVAVFSTFADAIKTLFEENPKPTPVQADYAEAQKEYEKKVRQKILKVMKAAGQASGIPVYNVVRDADAIWNNVFVKIVDGVKNGFEPTTGRGVLNELRETFDYLPFVDAQDNYDQLYNAVVDGDTRHYEKVYNNLIADGREESTINSELASRLAKNDGRVAAAYEAMADADAVTAASKVSELKEAGFSDEVINRALKQHEEDLEKVVAEDERIARAAQARYSMDYDEYEKIIKELVAEGYRENIVKNAADSAKIELETKAYEFALGDKDMYTASYDLQNALVNGDSEDVKKVYDKISEINGKSKADSKMISEIKKAYGDDMISRETAEKYLKDYSDDETTDQDISRTLYEAKSETGSVYDKLDASIDNGENIEVEYLFEYGVEEDDIRQHLTSKYKNKLLDMEKDSDEYNELYESLIDAYGEAGYSKFKAIKTIKEWFD